MALPEIKVKIGADTKEAEAGLDRVQREMRETGTAATSASSKTARMSSAMRDVGRRSAGMQRGIQNAAFQVGDFAVQVGAGTSASRALAMQLPQLLGGFGVMGAVMGAVVAIAAPLVTVMREMKVESDELYGVFGTLEPVVRSIGSAMQYVGEVFSVAGSALINNIDRILTIGATAAAFFAGKWVVGFVAARVATFSLAGALTFLRGALIRTGIGALLVGVGELVFQFTRLGKAAGGFGEALALIVDVGKEAFERIGMSVKLLKTNFQIVINDIQFAWTVGLGNMQVAFGKFLDGIAARAPAVFGFEGGNAAAAQAAMAESMAGITDELEGLLATQSALEAGLDAPYESIQKIRDLMSGMKEEGITLPNLLGLDGDEEGGGKKTLDEKLKDQENRIREHLERIAGLTQGSLSGQLGSWGDYFTNLATLTGSSNEKLLKLGKAFAASQALIDAWRAHNQVLADPRLSWWQKVASAVQVLGAGLGAVSAINSVGSGGGGSRRGAGAGVGSPSSAGASSAPLEARISGVSPDSLFTGSSITSLFDALQEEAGDRGLSVSFAQ